MEGDRRTWISRAFARDDLVVLALADPAQRIVLAQRVAAVAVPRKDSSHVRVADENDAEHVVDLALHPFRAGPDGTYALDLQAWIALLDRDLVAHVLAGTGVARRVQEDLEPDP